MGAFVLVAGLGPEAYAIYATGGAMPHATGVVRVAFWIKSHVEKVSAKLGAKSECQTYTAAGTVQWAMCGCDKTISKGKEDSSVGS